MKKPAPLDELRPLESAIRRKRIVVFDVESKDGNSQRPGFSRAFQVGFYEVSTDSETSESSCAHEKVPSFGPLWGQCELCGERDGYRSFRNVTRAEAPKASIALEDAPIEERAILRGGCVDRFMRFLVGYASKPETISHAYASSTTTIYAHNGGRFDATFVLAWLRLHAREFDTRITCVASGAQRILVTRKLSEETRGYRKLRRNQPSWCFIDSAKLIPMSLAQAAETFCANDPDIRKMTEWDLATHENDPGWEIYNRVDCLVLYRALTAFQALLEDLGGEMGITAPSASMKLFRRSFLKEPISRNRHWPSCASKKYACEDRDDACLHSWIRKGYHGGRVEIFRTIGPTGLRYYDLNSSYPASMRAPMPVGRAKEVSPEDFDALVPALERSHVGFVECTVFVPETCEVPPLSILCEGEGTPDDGKLRFPTGYLHGVWSWDELKTIFDPYVGGRIVGPVTRSVWFEARPIFREFVDALYSYRIASKKAPDDPAKAALSELCKLMLNSHYGKYGMNPEREELVTVHGGHDPMPGDRGSLYPTEGVPLDGDHLTGDVWIIPKRIDACYMIPQIAAQVTALSRVALWRACVSAVQQGGRLCYVDTDSLLVAAPPMHPFDHDDWFSDLELEMGTGDKLGQWKREMPTWVLSAQFLLPKSYLLRDTTNVGLCGHVTLEKDGSKTSCLLERPCPKHGQVVKLKGVGRKARTEANFEKLARGETVHYERVEQHRTVLKEGRAAPRLVIAKKRVVSTYDKREILPGGGTRAMVLDMRGSECVS